MSVTNFPQAAEHREGPSSFQSAIGTPLSAGARQTTDVVISFPHDNALRASARNSGMLLLADYAQRAFDCPLN